MSIGVGQFGGNGGDAFDFKNSNAVIEVIVRSGAAIDSITFKYYHDGTISWSPNLGGEGGSPNPTIVLDYPNEFLTRIEGYYSPFGNVAQLIRSLTFYTNKGKKYGPYGAAEGTYFNIPTKGAEIVGFFGRSGWLLDAIGVYLRAR
ncbi:hypothetical protein QJS04_geneDACA023716 [Acorus gramineus]|uniref:Jacalin-type lectin domain-containing protein n=1 Tax=Acorus gramineus TaxID=55184 RepID=A0AAV9A179_ACOGR|nr:hypothetical protein QJS04_geneDACA023716 [Acorus gramineus]